MPRRTCAGVDCRRVVVTTACGVPLCEGHREALAREFGQPERPEAIVTIVRRDVEAVVYYLGDPETQLVKIGTSTGLNKRLKILRVYHPKLVLLATEPGHYELERARHHQFHHLLAQGREWFRKDPELMQHIAVLRGKHGVPDALPERTQRGRAARPNLEAAS